MPAAGDWLMTVGARGIGSVYLILASREVKRRDPAAPRRFVLEVQPGYTVEDVEQSLPCKVWNIHWYPRKRRGACRRSQR